MLEVPAALCLLSSSPPVSVRLRLGAPQAWGAFLSVGLGVGERSLFAWMSVGGGGRYVSHAREKGHPDPAENKELRLRLPGSGWSCTKGGGAPCWVEEGVGVGGSGTSVPAPFPVGSWLPLPC